MHTKSNVSILFLTLSEAEDTDFRQGFTFYLFSGTNFTYQTWRSHTGPAEALKHGAVSQYESEVLSQKEVGIVSIENGTSWTNPKW